ncbi:MAG: hypothetical protein R3C61_20310 [Bacteroidia bacterium]
MEKNEGGMDQKGVDNYGVDYDYFPALGIEDRSREKFSQKSKPTLFRRSW